MNPRLIVLLLIVSTLTVLGCDKHAKEQTPETKEEPRVASTDKSIVVYFSRAGEQLHVGYIAEGNTSIVAKMIAQKTGADLFEVKPKADKYNTPYRQLENIAKKEQDAKARPEYVEPAPNLSQYDVIFFGAPVWWNDWPMIMYTFFENNDLQGKKLIPFSTHSGSGLSRFDFKLARYYPYCTVLKGESFLGEDVQKDSNLIVPDLDKWLIGLGFTLRPNENENKVPEATDANAAEASSETPVE